MCDTNSKAYHDAEQEAFAQIQAEDEAALNREIAEANLAVFLSENPEEWTPIGELEWDDCPKCPSCGSNMNQERDFTHGCGNMCYMCS